MQRQIVGTGRRREGKIAGLEQGSDGLAGTGGNRDVGGFEIEEFGCPGEHQGVIGSCIYQKGHGGRLIDPDLHGEQGPSRRSISERDLPTFDCILRCPYCRGNR